MNLWRYYRVDFASTGSTTTGLGLTPSNSWEWVADGWKRRSRADAPINVSDAKGRIFVQIDTLSTELGSNVATSADLNVAGAPVAEASTGTLGGRFDNSSLGYFQMITGIGDGIRISRNLSSSFMETIPPLIRFRYDRNTTVAAYSSVFISFKT